MSETQLDRFERKFDQFVEYVQGEFAAVRAEIKLEVAGVRAELRSEIADARSELKSEIADLRAELRTFRSEFQEKYENLSDRLRLVESRLAALALEQSRIRQTLEHGLNEVRAETEQVRLKIEAIEAATLDNSLRIIQLRDDIQQRFRIVSERLTAVEKQLAA